MHGGSEDRSEVGWMRTLRFSPRTRPERDQQDSGRAPPAPRAPGALSRQPRPRLPGHSPAPRRLSAAAGARLGPARLRAAAGPADGAGRAGGRGQARRARPLPGACRGRGGRPAPPPRLSLPAPWIRAGRK